jgi:hypothetical protein
MIAIFSAKSSVSYSDLTEHIFKALCLFVDSVLSQLLLFQFLGCWFRIHSGRNLKIIDQYLLPRSPLHKVLRKMSGYNRDEEVITVGGEWLASRPGNFTSGERTPVPIGEEAKWTPDLVWKTWRRENS